MTKKFTAKELPPTEADAARRVVRRTDIEAPEALGEGQRLLASLLSDLPGVAYRCRNDMNWTAQFVSEGSRALTGYSAAEFVSGARMYGDLMHPEDRARVWSETQAAV